MVAVKTASAEGGKLRNREKVSVWSKVRRKLSAVRNRKRGKAASRFDIVDPRHGNQVTKKNRMLRGARTGFVNGMLEHNLC